jgi:hypothetical protein
VADTGVQIPFFAESAKDKAPSIEVVNKVLDELRTLLGTRDIGLLVSMVSTLSQQVKCRGITMNAST